MTLNTNPYLAKYPYIEDARKAMQNQDIGDALTDDAILRRATERIVRGVNTSNVNPPKDTAPISDEDYQREALSYPVARMLISLVGDFRIINRYSRAEARTARQNLEKYARTGGNDAFDNKHNLTLAEALGEFNIAAESTTLADELHRIYPGDFLDTATPDQLHSFARDIFNLENPQETFSKENLEYLNTSEIYQTLHNKSNLSELDADWYRIPFTSYVTVATGMSDAKWRLTNRGLHDGELIVTYNDLFDLFEEAVYQRVNENLPHDVNENITEILQNAEPFSDLAEPAIPSFWEDIPASREDVIELDDDNEKVGDAEYEYIELIQAAMDDDHFAYEIDRVEPGLFPPVIDRLLDGVRNGENLQHEARFTLVAFLIHIGMTADEIVEMLGVGGSFGEEATRYQVNHIRAGGGGGEPYTPANYPTLESWGLTWEKDALEAQVSNPLSYYKIKLQDADEQDDEADDEDDSDDNDESESKEQVEVAPKKETEGGISASDVEAFAESGEE